MGVLVDWYGSD